MDSRSIDKLATYRGTQATAALLALAHRRRVNPGNREAAIAALARRGDPDVAAQLAMMLQQNEDLAMREAIAGALRTLPCGRECVERVLRYLEQRWYGEKAAEENLGSSDHAGENSAIERNLRAVLAGNPETIRVLGEEYGIARASLAPSPFATDLVVKLGLKSACPQLQSSRQELTDLRARNSPLIQVLADAESKLGCR